MESATQVMTASVSVIEMFRRWWWLVFHKPVTTHHGEQTIPDFGSLPTQAAQARAIQDWRNEK